MKINKTAFLAALLILALGFPSFAAGKPNTLAERALKVARKYLGQPYRYGGSSPRGFDCSGLVTYVFRKIGINLPRNEHAMLNAGRRVKKNNLKPGDILFFVNTYRRGISHVAIYEGKNRFIHAERWGYGVRRDYLSHPYYARRYYAACRPYAML